MKKLAGILLALVFCLGLGLGPAGAECLVVTYRAPESPGDTRYDYDNRVLALALEKTRDTWGGYELVPSPAMNFSRALHMLETGELVNPMFKHSANDETCAKLPYAAFPVDLGIVSYRLFFVSPKINRALGRVHTLGDLRAFSIGQGCGWLDVDILRHAGLDVVVVPDYACLFKMVSLGRFDLLSRGVNEVRGEYEHFRHLWDFEMNQRLGLYYKLPRFFFTDHEGRGAAARVQEGLERAYRDGSLQELWEREYRESLDFARLEDKVFFEIANPFLKTIDTGYERYFFKRPWDGREQARKGGR